MRGVTVHRNHIIKPNAIKAFGLGLVAIFPIVLSRHFSETEFLVNLAISLAIVIYAVLWLVIVHGPGKWKNFRWVPSDPIRNVLTRGASWVAGIALSFVIYETAYA